MHRVTKETSIPPSVKSLVWRRDFGRCVICGDHNAGPHCHYVRRSQLGRGIEQNVWTGCERCHREFDSEGTDGLLHKTVERHLRSWYPDWDKSDLVYRKYNWRNET